MEIDFHDVSPDELESCFENYRLTHKIQSPYHDKSYDDRLIVTRIVKANSELKDIRLPLFGGMHFQHRGKFCVVFKPAGKTFKDFLSTKANRDLLFDFPSVGLERNKAFRVSQYFRDMMRNLLVFVEVMINNRLSCNFNLEQCYIFDMDGVKATMDVVDVDKLKYEDRDFYHALAKFIRVICQKCNEPGEVGVNFNMDKDMVLNKILNTLETFPHHTNIKTIMTSSFFWSIDEKIIFLKNLRDLYDFHCVLTHVREKVFLDSGWISALENVAEMKNWKKHCDAAAASAAARGGASRGGASRGGAARGGAARGGAARDTCVAFIANSLVHFENIRRSFNRAAGGAGFPESEEQILKAYEYALPYFRLFLYAVGVKLSYLKNLGHFR